ncbi:MAG: hypothetical protein FJ266_11055 [Planctomycetes bacterium]|nr:hypothetical protein [Planctomycetota bacterium]
MDFVVSAQSNDNRLYLAECGYAQAGENDDELNRIKSGVQVINLNPHRASYQEAGRRNKSTNK